MTRYLCVSFQNSFVSFFSNYGPYRTSTHIAIINFISFQFESTAHDLDTWNMNLLYCEGLFDEKELSDDNRSYRTREIICYLQLSPVQYSLSWCNRTPCYSREGFTVSHLAICEKKIWNLPRMDEKITMGAMIYALLVSSFVRKKTKTKFNPRIYITTQIVEGDTCIDGEMTKSRDENDFSVFMKRLLARNVDIQESVVSFRVFLFFGN